MQIDLLKYKILLDDKSETSTNKILNYKKYGFITSDLVEILFVLTTELLSSGSDYFCNQLEYSFIKLLQNELYIYLNKSISIENKQLCLLWIQIFDNHIKYNKIYFNLISRMTKLEEMYNNLENKYTFLENNIKYKYK